MVLYVQRARGDREFYVLQREQDFEKVFEQYPTTHSIAMMSHGLKHAADNIAKYLSNHHLTAWVEDGEFNKSLRDTAIGLGLSTAAALGLGGQHPIQHPPKAQVQSVDNFGKAPEDKFLWSIMQLESSGGKNLKHKVSDVIGRWGIKKPTINEMLDRAGANLPAHLGGLRHMDAGQTAAHFKQNPQSELDIARMLASHVLKRHKGDTQKAAYSWRHGHNLQSHDIPSGALQNSGYVRQFKFMHMRNPLAARPVVKSDDNRSFSQKLSDWLKRRREEEQKDIPRDHSYSYDPGRLKDEEAERREDTDGVWKLKINTMAAEGKRREK